MRLLINIFLLFALLFNERLLAQNINAGIQLSDIDFISSKIKSVYAGFKDKMTILDFEKLIRKAKESNEKDTLALLSKIILPFNDQHLAIYQRLKNMEADSNISKKKYLQLLTQQSKQNPYEGYWINDLNSIMIYLKLTGNDEYEGYIMESESKPLLGYCVLKMQKIISGKRITDYTDVRGQFRTFTKSHFKDSQTLITGTFNKWHKIKNYKKGWLKNVVKFDINPTVCSIDSNTVLIKMHDFSSRGVAKKYDSLIKINDRIIANCKNLIIDIRYNDGGSIRNFVPLLPYICGQPIVRVGYYQKYSQDLIDEAQVTRKIYAQQNDSIRVKAYDTAIAKMRRNINKLIYSVADTLACKPVKNNIKNVGLVFNFGSRSAAELMVLHFKQIKSVTTFGEPSGGAVDYLDELRFNLPVSNYIYWVASTKREITNKEPSYDYHGIKPDVLIGEKITDWINFVKKYYD